MIAWLKGNILEFYETSIIINAGSIGYEIFLGPKMIAELKVSQNKELELAIYTSVKEDEISLLGFKSFDQRKIFTLLISVNGIGPKAALNIVDHLSTNEIISSIRSQDIRSFQMVSGIGKKTAQRIVIDLEEKIKKLDTSSYSPPSETENDPVKHASLLNNTFNDAKSALINLGFADRQVEHVLRKHYQTGVELNKLITTSLQELSTKNNK